MLRRLIPAYLPCVVVSRWPIYTFCVVVAKQPAADSTPRHPVHAKPFMEGRFEPRGKHSCFPRFTKEGVEHPHSHLKEPDGLWPAWGSWQRESVCTFPPQQVYASIDLVLLTLGAFPGASRTVGIKQS